MATLHISSNCVTRIELQGAAFGKVVRKPTGNNVRTFTVRQHALDMEVIDMNSGGIQASIEVLEEGGTGGAVIVSSDSNAVPWWGATKFYLDHPNGQTQHEVKSGTGGDPNSKKTQRFAIPAF